MHYLNAVPVTCPKTYKTMETIVYALKQQGVPRCNAQGTPRTLLHS